MPPASRRLTKREVEALLAAVQGPADSVLEEITVVRSALTDVLRTLTGDGREWTDLVAWGAAAGGWEPARLALLSAAADPDRAGDAEAVLEALWDLVQELNERRRIAP